MEDMELRKIDKAILTMIENIENVSIRKNIYSRLTELAMVSGAEYFAKLVEELMKFEDGKEVIYVKWKNILTNVSIADKLMNVMIKDKEMQKKIVSNVKFLLHYGSFTSLPELAEEISKLECGQKAVAEHFEEFLEYSYSDFDKLFISVLGIEEGRKKVKEHFHRIRDGRNVVEFFNVIKALDGVEGFESEVEDYGFWAKLYDQIQLPETAEIHTTEFYNLSIKEREKRLEANNALLRKNHIFKKIIDSDDRFEKRLILEEISKGNPFEFKGIGAFSVVAKTGNQVIKLGREKRSYEIPYHPRIMMPCFRKQYQDGSTLEIFDLGETTSEKISSEKVLEIYKELEEAGIIWGDARKENLVVLLKDNTLPDYIVSKDFNVFGFIEDAKFPTTEHKALKAGDIVICDLDLLYSKDDKEIEYGPIDDSVVEYLNRKKAKKIDKNTEGR